MVAAQPTPPPRISASASPIPADAVGTIRMTLSVALLTAPNGQATMRLEGPKGMIDQGAFFSVRYYVHGRARRAIVQAQRVTQASVNRDLVTVKIISDAMVQQRDARREPVNLGARARFLSGTEDDARILFDIELADVSLSGVGLDSHVELTKGDRLEVQIGDVTAEVEIVRADPLASVQFGGRFVKAEEGAALFAIALDAIWSAPRIVPQAGPGEIAIRDPDQSRNGGMRTRRND
jgi:hypothetical protein